MMAKQRKATAVPELRFPDFREAPEWKCGNASDIVDVLQGYGFPERFQGGKDGEFPFYKVSDISACVDAGGVFLTDANNHIDSDTMAELRAKPMPVEATVFAKIGEAIRSNKRAITTRPCLVDNNAAGVKAIAGLAHDRFVYYLWCQVPLIEYAGGVVPSVNKSAIEQIQISYPQPDEQRKIADCLTSLDEVISAQGRKVEALKAHKRGLIQQLFPREGEARPRLRFPEFRKAPEWLGMPLGKVAEIKLGKMLDANKHKSGRLLPFVNNISLRWNGVDTSDLPQMYFKESELERYGLQVGDVLVCEGGEPGRAAVWDGRLPDLKFQKAVHRVRFHVPFVPKILVLYLEAIAGTNAFESLFTGGGIKHLTGETFAKLTIPVMPLPEQQRIADCLSSLDAQIAAESNQLAALKTHKQGLMQQLFPSGSER